MELLLIWLCFSIAALLVIAFVCLASRNWKQSSDLTEAPKHLYGHIYVWNGLFYDKSLEEAYQSWERKSLTVYSLKLIAVVFFVKVVSSEILWRSTETVSPELQALGAQMNSFDSIEIMIFSCSVIIFISTTLLGFENRWKRFFPPAYYPWFREVLLPAVLSVVTAIWATMISYKLTQCSFGFWKYWEDYAVEDVPLACVINLWSSSATYKATGVSVRVGAINAMTRTNYTSQLLLQQAVRPWLSIQLGLSYILFSYLGFFVYFMVGLTTYDMHFRWCCSKPQRRCGYRFGVIQLSIPLIVSLVRLLSSQGFYVYINIHLIAHVFVLMVSFGFYGIAVALKSLWFAQVKLNEANSNQRRLIRHMFDDLTSVFNAGPFRQIQGKNSKLVAVLKTFDDIAGNVDLRLRRKEFKQLEALSRSMSQICERGETAYRWSHSLLKSYVKSLNYRRQEPEYQSINIKQILTMVQQLYSHQYSVAINISVKPSVPITVNIETSALLGCCTSLIRHLLHMGAKTVGMQVSYRENEKILFEIMDPNTTQNKRHTPVSHQSKEGIFGHSDETKIGLRVVHSITKWLGEDYGEVAPCYSEIKIIDGNPTLCPYGTCHWFTLTNKKLARAPSISEKDNDKLSADTLQDGLKTHQSGELTSMRQSTALISNSSGDVRLEEILLDVEIPVWDRAEFLSILEGQEHEALNIFRSEHEEILQVLEQKYAQKDYLEVMRQVHKIKSSSKIVGALKLHAMCREIEKQNGMVGLEKLKLAIAQLNESFEAFLKEL